MMISNPIIIPIDNTQVPNSNSTEGRRDKQADCNAMPGKGRLSRDKQTIHPRILRHRAMHVFKAVRLVLREIRPL